MSRIEVIVGCWALKRHFFRLDIVFFDRRRWEINFFWWILSTISRLTLKFGSVGPKSLYILGFHPLSLSCLRNIMLIILCLGINFNLRRLIFLNMSVYKFRLPSNPLWRIIRPITRLHQLRIITLSQHLLSLSISCLRSNVVMLIVIVIGSLCLQFISFLRTFMLAWINYQVPQLHISQRHLWSNLLDF